MADMKEALRAAGLVSDGAMGDARAAAEAAAGRNATIRRHRLSSKSRVPANTITLANATSVRQFKHLAKTLLLESRGNMYLVRAGLHECNLTRTEKRGVVQWLDAIEYDAPASDPDYLAYVRRALRGAGATTAPKLRGRPGVPSLSRSKRSQKT